MDWAEFIAHSRCRSRTGKANDRGAQRSLELYSVTKTGSPTIPIGARIHQQGGTEMGDKGSKDKGKREQQKTAQHTAKEKRKIKNDKKSGKKPFDAARGS